ncbi:MarR family transcriptional regulator [Streptomyces sp. SID6673]|nr:MarR family transcriptional regulator [Streptomyces sp. SID11726]NEB27042.1 MarR family transcriptional regulator [Streptomyces sp. SID6673]
MSATFVSSAGSNGNADDTADALYALMADFVRQRPRDMSMTAAATLTALRQRGPQRITALAGTQGITQPSMTSLIASLEKSGLVARRDDPADGRASLIELTEVGLDYIVERRRQVTDRIGEYIESLPTDQRSALAAALPALRGLEEMAGEDVP